MLSTESDSALYQHLDAVSALTDSYTFSDFDSQSAEVSGDNFPVVFLKILTKVLRYDIARKRTHTHNNNNNNNIRLIRLRQAAQPYTRYTVCLLYTSPSPRD